MFIGIVLLAVYGSDGCEGRCDARCYNAKSEGCDCCCGGRNHGVGLDQACENVREMYEPILDELKRIHGDTTIECHPSTNQLSLFTTVGFANQVLAS